MQSLRKLLRIARQFVLQWVNIAGQLSGNIGKRRSLDSQQQRILWQNLTILSCPAIIIIIVLDLYSLDCYWKRLVE